MKKKSLCTLILFFSFFAYGFENPDSVNEKLFRAGDNFLLEFERFIETENVERMIAAEKLFEEELTEYSKSQQFKNFSGKNRNYDILIDRLLTNVRLISDEDLDFNEKIKYGTVISQTLLKLSQFNSLYYNHSVRIHIFVMSGCFCFLLVILLIFFHFRRKIIEMRVELAKNQEYTNIVFETIENERGKISNELHDTVAQEIRAIKFEADDKKENSYQKISKIAENCIKELRGICYNLLPADLKHGGAFVKIENLMEFLCFKFSQDNLQIECCFRADKNLPLIQNQEVMLNVFRIVQEALNNIKNHSKAKYCSVVVSRDIEFGGIGIYITDNGVGIKDEYLKNGRKMHFGLHSMQSRAEMIGAKLEIFSAENDGTEIILKVKAE